MDLNPPCLDNALAFKPVAERALDMEMTDEQTIEHLVTLGIQHLVTRIVDPQEPKISVATVLALVDRDPQAFAGFLDDLLSPSGVGGARLQMRRLGPEAALAEAGGGYIG